MPTRIKESNIDWEFHDGWTASKYDGWTWYRKHFNACAESAAVDFVVVAVDDRTAWLVEVKDFTTQEPDKAKGPLHEVITRKVRDTLAGLTSAAVNGDGAEAELARRFRRVESIRVAFQASARSTGAVSSKTFPMRLI